ncbi:DsrE family protein [Boseongicola aestuarii]|uniref:DsrE/DsrF-like family protein n=1 Tax=Boseongicola aestuarii TaxID=1470561 RepID=A0A238J5I9_9RHOB|nr:DsrE family protein [Boseongicola aestuarii]SMX25611.1 DsrE/DsrF-like family protein [Boseongicola aestuarii]
MNFTRTFVALLAMCWALAGIPASAHDDAPPHEIHKIVIQVSDNSEGTFTKVLNNASNMSNFFLTRGEEYEIEIVAYNAGLHMLRTDTSPVLERIQSFTDSVPNVTISACGNTIKGMSKQAGRDIEIVPNARVVPGGIVRLMELSDQGYFMIRP